jgi:hypothetical protein
METVVTPPEEAPLLLEAVPLLLPALPLLEVPPLVDAPLLEESPPLDDEPAPLDPSPPEEVFERLRPAPLSRGAQAASKADARMASRQVTLERRSLIMAAPRAGPARIPPAPLAWRRRPANWVNLDHAGAP